MAHRIAHEHTDHDHAVLGDCHRDEDRDREEHPDRDVHHDAHREVLLDEHEMPSEFDATDLRGDRAPRSARPIELQSRRVRLEVPDDRHLMSLWELAADPSTSFRWRYHGRVPSPQEFANDLWDGVATQFVAIDVRTRQPVAWLIAYNLNPRDQHVFVAVHGWPEHLASINLLDSVFVFFRYLFANFSLRKVYAEVREFNVTQFASGAGRFFEIEGRLRSHSFYDGIWWDQLILSLTAEQFDEVEQRYGSRWFGADGTDANAAFDVNTGTDTNTGAHQAEHDLSSEVVADVVAAPTSGGPRGRRILR